jgi:hypothetical protein
MDFEPHIGCDNDNGATSMGSAALNLLSQAAEAVALNEVRQQSELQTVLDQLNSAEVRHRLLTQRVHAAEASAEEAEQWLRRVHSKIEAELLPRPAVMMQ